MTITKMVTQTRQREFSYQMPLTGLKASTADGKEISGDDLEKKLADPTAVVQVQPGFDPEWKKLFADDVIFLEAGRNVLPGVGGPGGALRPIAPALPGGGPAALPAEKKEK